MKGKYRTGYAVNNQEMLKLQLTKGSTIGAFECSYDRRSKYIYRASTDVEGYFINKRSWKLLELNHPLFFRTVRRRALHHFSHVIHKNLEICKAKDIAHFDKRSDYKQVMVVQDYDKYELIKIIMEEWPEGEHHQCCVS